MRPVAGACRRERLVAAEQRPIGRERRGRLRCRCGRDAEHEGGEEHERAELAGHDREESPARPSGRKPLLSATSVCNQARHWRGVVEPRDLSIGLRRAMLAVCAARSVTRRWPTSMATLPASRPRARCTGSTRPSAATGRPPRPHRCGRRRSLPCRRGRSTCDHPPRLRGHPARGRGAARVPAGLAARWLQRQPTLRAASERAPGCGRHATAYDGDRAYALSRVTAASISATVMRSGGQRSDAARPASARTAQFTGVGTPCRSPRATTAPFR